MAIRGSANFSSGAPGPFARRALAQSLAREFGPQGIHVCHVIIDGVIDTARVHAMMEKAGKQAEDDGTRIKPDDIGQVYLDIVKQRPSAWTQELDIR